MVAERLPDAAHELVAALHPLVGVGVRPQRDVLALPRGLAQLGPQDLGDVDLDDDLLLEIASGVEVEIRVRGTGEAVVADDAVRDEVAGPGRDVEQLHCPVERLHRYDPQVRVAFHRTAFQPELSADRRIGEVEEPQLLSETAEYSNRGHPVVGPSLFGSIVESELLKTCARPRENDRIAVADPERFPTAGPLGIE